VPDVLKIYFMIIFVLFCFGLIYIIVAAKHARKLNVVNQNFTKTPENPVKIAFISDIHISLMPIDWQKVCNTIAQQKADFAVLGGDFCEKGNEGEAVLAFFDTLLSYVPYEIFLVYGNHDNQKMFKGNLENKKIFTKSIQALSPRIHVLENEGILHEVKGRKIFIGGLGDIKTNNVDIDSLTTQWSEISKDTFLLVTHNADALLQINNSKPDLVLCGHTHGGQLWMPFRMEFWLFRKDKLPRQGYIYGPHRFKGISLYISSGLGCTFLVLRYGSKAEIAVIEI